MGFQPSYPGAQDYDIQAVAGPGAASPTWAAMNAAGTNPYGIMGVNAGADTFGNTVGMGNIDPKDYGKIAGTDYINSLQPPPPPPPAVPALNPTDQAFADQVKQMYGTGSGQQLAMGNLMGPGGYSFARPGGGTYGQALGNYWANMPGGMPGGGGGMFGGGGMPGGGMPGGGGGGMPAGLLDALRALLTQYGIK
jgi:hypothetical protein